MARKFKPGTLLKHWAALKLEIAKAEAALRALKNKEDTIKADLMKALEEGKTTGISDTHASATLAERVIPKVEDWDTFYKYIRRNNAFYLLQRRPTEAPYRELLKERNGKGIPGVKSGTLKTLTFHKKG